MNDLNPIIALICERLLHDGEWTLTLGELEGLLDPVTLYRSVYEMGLIGRDRYDQSCAGELVSLLERAVSPDAESKMRDRGLFLNHEDRIGLTERFVRHLQRAVVMHLPEPEIFRGMIAQFRHYELSEQAYCDTYLSLDPIKHRCAEEHTDGRTNADVHMATAKWYLGTLVDRRIVNLRDLGPALFDLLRTVGRQEGVLPQLAAGSEDDRGAEAGQPGSDATDETPTRDALKLFGLNADGASREMIRSQYRQLMRRYHPDVNPDGLEVTKRINAAYGLLLTTGDQR